MTNPSLNPLAKLTPVPEQSSDQFMVSLLNTKASTTIAKAGSAADADLKMIPRVGALPWEQPQG
jgi:hypothetical protein